MLSILTLKHKKSHKPACVYSSLYIPFGVYLMLSEPFGSLQAVFHLHLVNGVVGVLSKMPAACTFLDQP